MPFQRFPSAERTSEFPCVCDATGENMRTPDNAENTRARSTFDSRAFFAISCSALQTLRFPGICKYCVYEYTYRVRYTLKQYHEESFRKFANQIFRKFPSRSLNFVRENIDLNLTVQSRVFEIGSFLLNLPVVESFNFRWYITWQLRK